LLKDQKIGVKNAARIAGELDLNTFAQAKNGRSLAGLKNGAIKQCGVALDPVSIDAHVSPGAGSADC
jgi:hypothetical protein